MDYDTALEYAIAYLKEEGSYWFWLNGQMNERDFEELLENTIIDFMEKKDGKGKNTGRKK